MEHEGQPFQRRQRFEHDEQGEPDTVGQHRGMLRVAAVRGGDDRIGDEHVERLLGVGPALPQAVEADPAGDGGQPAADVRDAGQVGPGESEPGVLHRVVGFAERPEHPVAHRPQVRAVGVEQVSPLVGHRSDRSGRAHTTWPAGWRIVALTRLNMLVTAIHITIEASCSSVKCSAAAFHT